MKIMVTSFKKSHAGIAAVSAANPAAGHCWPIPPPEVPGHSQESLDQCLVGSLLPSPGSCCTQGCVCALQESIYPVLCKFSSSMAGLMAASSMRAYAIPKSAAPSPSLPHPEHLPLWPSTADQYLRRRYSNTVLTQSHQTQTQNITMDLEPESTIANCEPNPAYWVFLIIQFYWNSVTPIHLHVVFGCFHAGTWMAHKAKSIICSFTEKALTPDLNILKY